MTYTKRGDSPSCVELTLSCELCNCIKSVDSISSHYHGEEIFKIITSTFTKTYIAAKVTHTTLPLCTGKFIELVNYEKNTNMKIRVLKLFPSPCQVKLLLFVNASIQFERLYEWAQIPLTYIIYKISAIVKFQSYEQIQTINTIKCR